MGEANRRKQAGQPWKGALPDALFVRLPAKFEADAAALLEANGIDLNNVIALHGNLHVLRPPPDEASLMQLVSKLADQLMDPDRVPALDDPAVMQMWADPARAWAYGLAETLEIKRLLPRAAIVRVAMSDHPDHCVFAYDRVTDTGQNRLLADGLSAPRPG